ncbi:erythromycin esterase [Neptunitalea sp. Y10]|uniref:Erythromycin esterase n=1 Tax=Neptunitalea lumnitzerae TaxID=2965509 RepID=A0ABQ5MI78_9FLAO|nr:erythromycin esterase [Neptunitalea sp. Y10]
MIGFGEATHGTSEFLKMRHRLFAYLVNEHNFNTLFLETDPGSCVRADAYVKGANDTLSVVTKELRQFMFTTTEMSAFIEWIRNYNLSHSTQQISIVGVDMQTAHKNINTLYALIKDATVKKNLTPFLSSYNLYEDRTTLTPIVTSIQANSKNTTIKLLCDAVLQNLELDLKNQNKIEENAQARDQFLAKNIETYYALNSQTKGLFLAHNGHVSFYTTKGYTRSGKFLKDIFNNAYYAIGTEFEKGSFIDTQYSNEKKTYVLHKFEIEKAHKSNLSGYLATLPSDIYFITTNEIPKSKKRVHFAGGGFTEKYPYGIETTTDFDAFIFIRNSTPTHSIKK